VEPVVPCVLKNEENTQLDKNISNGREWNLELDTNVLAQWVEEPDRESLDEEMRCQNRLETLPLFLIGWKLCFLDSVLVKVWDSLDDEPRQTSTEIEEFMDGEEQQSGSEQVIAHVVVVSTPKLLEHVQALDLLEVVEGISERGYVLEASVVVIHGGHYEIFGWF